MINSYDIAILSEKVAALENAEHDSQTASAIEYDNTGSGLTADDVQEAIDELAEASGISYDNTDSGLTAGNVQVAIDEIAESLNGDEITGLTSQFIDITKVSAYKIGRFVIISINDAEVTSNMAAFESFIDNVPPASMRTLGSLAVLSAGAVVTNTSCYTVSGNIGVRSLSALTSGQVLTGSIIIIV